MEINIDRMIKRQLMVILCLWGLLCAQNMNAMRIGAGLYGQQNPAAAHEYAIFQDQLSKLSPNECLLCQKDTFKCIKVNTDIFPTIEMLNKYKDTSEKRFQLDFPIQAIRNAVNIATTYSLYKNPLIKKNEVKKIIQNYSLAELANAANVLDYLNWPMELSNICLHQIKERIDIENLPEIQQLNPLLQGQLLIKPVISKLKKRIIEKHSSDRKIMFEKKLILIPPYSTSTIWSPDETKIGIVNFGGGEENRRVDLCTINNQRKITVQNITDDKKCMVFSPDNKKIAFTRNGQRSWIDIYNIDQKTMLETHIAACSTTIFNSIAFTSDSNHLFMISEDQDLFLLNLKDKDKKPQKINPDLSSMVTLAINPKGTILAVKGVQNGQKCLLLYDITNLEDISLLSTTPHEASSYNPMAFSPDSTMIVCGNENSDHPFTLFHLSDPRKIAVQHVIYAKNISSKNTILVMFTPDNKSLISSSIKGDKDNKILLWDINDLSDISHYDLGPGYSVSVAPSFTQGCRIAFLTRQDELEQPMIPLHTIKKSLWTLWTSQEQKSFESLEKCDGDQLRFIYGLCLKLEKGLSITIKQGTDEWDTFESLPTEIQNTLNDLLRAPRKSWFSGWW